MHKKTSTVLLIEDSSDFAELVEQWLAMAAAGTDTAFVLNWSDSLSAGLKRLGHGGVDLILLDLGLPDSNGLETFTSVRAEAPRVPILVLSAAGSESLALRTIQEGAEDYLVKSSANGETLARAIRFAIARHKAHTGNMSRDTVPDQPRAIGLLGAKGGVGTSTIAWTLAAELRRHTDSSVLLADVDVQGGLAAFLMSVEPKYSLLDAIGNAHHLDQSCWAAMAARCACGIELLASPCLFGHDDLEPESIRNALALIRPFYRWSVIDLGRLNTVSAALLEELTDLFVVTTPSIPALYQAKRVIDALPAADRDSERLRLIINQAEEVAIPDTLSGSEMKRLFGIPVYARLPRDGQELHEAFLNRRLVPEHSEFRRHVGELARRLAGLPSPKPRKGLHLLSFARRYHTEESVIATR